MSGIGGFPKKLLLRNEVVARENLFKHIITVGVTVTINLIIALTSFSFYHITRLNQTNFPKQSDLAVARCQVENNFVCQF